MNNVQRILVVLLVLGAALPLAGCGPAAPVPPVAPLSTLSSIPTSRTITVLPVVATVPPADDIPRIAVDELWQRLQAGEAIVVIDARGAEEYKTQHIAGAINVPAADVERRANELPKDKLLVFYCT